MKMNIHTKLSNKAANKIQVPSRFQDTLISETVMIWPLPFNKELSQLQLMPPTGQDIQAESSLTVQPDSTTELPSLEFKMETGGSKTLGLPHGERKDSSD